MTLADCELLKALQAGSLYPFSSWPHESVPRIAAGVYTIWEQTALIYVGVAGRGLSAENIAAPDEPRKAKGLWSRLNSHASGRRSGDQFCVYVCDRFVVPRLLPDQQAEIGAGVLSGCFDPSAHPCTLQLPLGRDAGRHPGAGLGERVTGRCVAGGKAVSQPDAAGGPLSERCR